MSSQVCNGIEFVKRLDQLLEEKNLSRKDLCSLVNLTPNAIATWKIRNSIPSAEILFQIAKKLHVSMEWLLTGASYQASDYERGKLSRKNIRDRIYKTLASKLKVERSADTETDHITFFSNMPNITYDTLISWEKGYINLESFVFEDIANSLGVSLEYLLTGNDSKNTNPQSFDNATDQNIYETAIRNLNDLFCLDNLSEERRKLAKDMLNQLMKLEHLEYVEKNRKNTQ